MKNTRGQICKKPGKGQYKAIGFDLDDTFYDFQQVMRHSLKFALDKILEKVPRCGDFLTIEKMIKIRDQVARQMKGKTTNLEEVRFRAFKKTLEYCGVADEKFARALNRLYLNHRFEDVMLFDEVLPTLERLRQRYVLGIISNGNSYPRKLGLEKYFRFIILSQNVGVEKPDPRIFTLAIHEVKCIPNEFLYVGDSQGDDIVGAKRAGVHVAWVNRLNEVRRSDIPRPDYEITTLSELLKILA